MVLLTLLAVPQRRAAPAVCRDRPAQGSPGRWPSACLSSDARVQPGLGSKTGFKSWTREPPSGFLQDSHLGPDSSWGSQKLVSCSAISLSPRGHEGRDCPGPPREADS